MIFSKRLELARKVEAWFDKADAEIMGGKSDRGPLGVICALSALGELKDDRTDSEERREQILTEVKERRNKALEDARQAYLAERSRLMREHVGSHYSIGEMRPGEVVAEVLEDFVAPTCPECGGPTVPATPSTLNRQGRALCKTCVTALVEKMREAAASTTFKPPAQEADTMVVEQPIPGQWDAYLGKPEVEKLRDAIFGDGKIRDMIERDGIQFADEPEVDQPAIVLKEGER